MFISSAFASDEAVSNVVDAASTAATEAPSGGEVMLVQFGFIAIAIVLFYILMIRPQQKRIKEHSNMVKALKKGEKIITQGGLIGTIDKEIDDHQLRIETGETKIVILRNSISSKYDDVINS